MSHVTFDEAEQIRQLKDFASGKYSAVTVSSELFLKLVSAYESDVADRVILGAARELARLAVSRGWSSKEFRKAHEDAYAEAIGEAAGTRGRSESQRAVERANRAIVRGFEASAALHEALLEDLEIDDG